MLTFGPKRPKTLGYRHNLPKSADPKILTMAYLVHSHKTSINIMLYLSNSCNQKIDYLGNIEPNSS